MKRKRKIKTFTLDPIVDRKFRNYCKSRGKVASREVEKMMRRLVNGDRE